MKKETVLRIHNVMVNELKKDRPLLLDNILRAMQDYAEYYHKCEVAKTNMRKGDIVIVLDLNNYKSDFCEEVPFKAKVVDRYDINTVVKSLRTSKEYELYDEQIMEYLGIDEIKNLIDMSKYGL